MTEQIKEGTLRVYYIRNVPSDPIYYYVSTTQMAFDLYNAIAESDLLNPNVHDNVIGLEIYEDGEWTEWYNDDGNTLEDAAYEFEEEQ